MSEVVIATVGIALLVITNVYWIRRVRTVRDGLQLSRDRALSQDVGAAELTVPGTYFEDAAKRADVSPEDLPERVDEMNEEIRSLNNQVDDLRRSWASSWWDALSRQPDEPESRRVLVITLERGEVDVAQAFAEVAVEHDTAVTIVVGLRDGSYSVTVGSELRDEVSAADIVDGISDRAGGGGGGSDSFATGGGAQPEELIPAVDAMREELEDRLSVE